MKKICFIFSMIFIASTAYTQYQNWWDLSVNGNFQIGIPLQDFGAKQENDGIGFGGSVLLQIQDRPVFAGLEGSWMYQGSQSEEFALNIDGTWEDYKLKTQSNIFLIHSLVRFQPDINFPLRPYVDGMFGFKNLYTRTSLKNLEYDEIEDSNSEKSDWVFSYGGALGLQLALFRDFGWSIDLRCAYLHGGAATYLAKREDTGQQYEEPIDAFDERSSSTILLMPQIGVSYRFATARYEYEEDQE